MKILAALSVLQIIAIIFLASRIMALDPQAPGAATANTGGSSSAAAEDFNLRTEPAAQQSYPDARQLRKIVREELAAQLNSLAAQPIQAGAEELPDPVLESERQYRLQLVEQEIAHYVRQGVISDSEMQSLQHEIAKLDPEGQKRMLARLVSALNSGELQGRL